MWLQTHSFWQIFTKTLSWSEMSKARQKCTETRRLLMGRVPNGRTGNYLRIHISKGWKSFHLALNRRRQIQQTVLIQHNWILTSLPKDGSSASFCFQFGHGCSHRQLWWGFGVRNNCSLNSVFTYKSLYRNIHASCSRNGLDTGYRNALSVGLFNLRQNWLINQNPSG